MWHFCIRGTEALIPESEGCPVCAYTAYTRTIVNKLHVGFMLGAQLFSSKSIRVV